MNIQFIVEFQGLGKQITLKCLINLRVNSWLPPSGIDPRHKKQESWIFILVFSFFSYTNLRSNIYLAISIGGLAP